MGTKLLRIRMDTYLYLDSYLDNFIIPILVHMFRIANNISGWICPHCVLLNLIMQAMFAQQVTIVSKFQSIFFFANMKSIAYDTQFQK